jgi:hypothetical protein
MATTPSFWSRALQRSVGLGLVAGGVEAVGLSATLTAPYGVVGFFGLGMMAVLTMAIVGILLGVPATLLVSVSQRGEPDERTGAAVMAFVATGLCAWFLWGAGWTLLDQGRTIPAVFFSMLPVPFGFVVAFNARYWLRRSRRGESRLSWLPVAAAASLVLVILAVVVHWARDTSGNGALAGDPSIVWITVDNLPVDHHGEPWLAGVPGAVRFSQAIAPTSSVRAGTAAVLTGLHPLRSGVVKDDQRLSRGLTTLPAAFAGEGYATGGFVGHPLLASESGLANGFRVYDDRMGPLGGLARVSVLRRLGFDTGDRSSSDVADAFISWYAGRSGRPLFGWVHLSADGVDAAIERIVDAIQDSESAGETHIAIAGLSHQGTVGVSDREVRVPLVLLAPGRDMSKFLVASQVRTYDLGPTALRYAQLDDLSVTEGIELLGYGTGVRTVPLPVVTLAEERIGLRSGGVAYEQDLEAGNQRIFDLDGDVTEDMSEAQPEALSRARSMLSAEVMAYRALLGVN